MGQIFRGDASSVVGDGNAGKEGIVTGGDSQRTARGRVLHAVFQDIPDGFHTPEPVAGKCGIFIDVSFYGYLFHIQHDSQRSERFQNQLLHVDRSLPEGHRAGFQPGDF